MDQCEDLSRAMRIKAENPPEWPTLERLEVPNIGENVQKLESPCALGGVRNGAASLATTGVFIGS